MKNTFKKTVFFLIIFGIYTGWMTGFEFDFIECNILPNYQMLTDAFLEGNLSIEDHPSVDYISYKGKRYLYSGPLPAVLRLPFTFMLKQRIPTGLMIVIFCTGIGFLFAKILKELTPEGEKESLRRIGIILNVTFMINGFSLFMVTIPSIHHEAICTAMFFLMIAIFCLVKIKNNNYRPSVHLSLLMGLSLTGCIASRFSYLFSAIFLGVVLLYGYIKNWHGKTKYGAFISLGIIVGFGVVTIASLMFYNYLRFDHFFEFGIQYIRSLYSGYFKEYGFFRWDHLPYNIWSIFFRIPSLKLDFPFIQLPTYILKSRSFNLNSLFLINANELCASIFLLMPISIFAIVPILSHKLLAKSGLKTHYLILLLICLLQLLPTALSVASTARYYYDFLPIFLILAYLGMMGLKIRHHLSKKYILLLAMLSVLLSFSLPMNGIRFYYQFIKYPSPLLAIFFKYLSFRI